MGLFDIFRRPKQPEILHPHFGRIVYQGDNTWELGKRLFGPIAHDVEVMIDAGPEGPTDAHERYWHELVARWPELKASCEPLLRTALKDWVETPERGDIWTRLDVESLHVYADSPPDQWELMFWCEEAGHWPTISMNHWVPKDCFVDG